MEIEKFVVNSPETKMMGTRGSGMAGVAIRRTATPWTSSARVRAALKGRKRGWEAQGGSQPQHEARPGDYGGESSAKQILHHGGDLGGARSFPSETEKGRGRRDGRGERLGCGRGSNAEAWGKKWWGIMGSGGACGSAKNREREGVVGGEGADRWAPSVGERERGRGWGRPAGLGPKREEGGCGVWAEQAKSEGG